MLLLKVPLLYSLNIQIFKYTQECAGPSIEWRGSNWSSKCDCHIKSICASLLSFSSYTCDSQLLPQTLVHKINATLSSAIVKCSAKRRSLNESQLLIYPLEHNGPIRTATLGQCEEVKRGELVSTGVKQSLLAQLALPRFTCSQCQAWREYKRKDHGSVRGWPVRIQELVLLCAGPPRWSLSTWPALRACKPPISPLKGKGENLWGTPTEEEKIWTLRLCLHWLNLA